MKRSLSAFLLLVLLTPTLAIAEEPASLRRSIAHVNFQGPGLPVRPPASLSPRRAPIPGRTHREIVYGVAGPWPDPLLVGSSAARSIETVDATIPASVGS